MFMKSQIKGSENTRIFIAERGNPNEEPEKYEPAAPVLIVMSDSVF